MAINCQQSQRNVPAPDGVTWNQMFQTWADTSPTLEEQLLQQEELERLHAVLAQLSSVQRQCLILRAEGFSYREIAGILKITGTNVAQSLHRGLKRVMRAACLAGPGHSTRGSN